MDPFKQIQQQIILHSSNKWAQALGYVPVYSAAASARMVIVGQAPGRVAQATRKPWNDVSGIRLRQWLGLSDEQFYDPSLVALIPMDFYYPGKGKHGDLPPRPGFAEQWHPLLLQNMPNVQLIILVGRYAQEYYLKGIAKRTLSETVMHHEEYGPKYFPIVHPSPLNFRWLAKHPWFEEEVVPTVRQRVHKILQNGS